MTTTTATPRAPRSTKKSVAASKPKPKRKAKAARPLADVVAAQVAALTAEGHGSTLWRDLENHSPFGKIGLYGGGGAGKSRTAVDLAIGIHADIKSRRPIGIADTENAARHQLPRFIAAGVKVKEMPSRSLADLGRLLQEAAGDVDVLIIDSVTAYWDDLMAAYKRQQQVEDLGPADWVAIKSVWRQQFSLPFVRAPLHIIFTARAAADYRTVFADDGGFETVKDGTKLRGEAELAFEPDVLIEMTRVEIPADDGGPSRTVRRATVKKDRTDVVDGRTFDNPTFADFAGAFAAIVAGAVNAGPVEERDAAELFTGTNKGDRREAFRLVEEAKGELNRAWSTTFPAGKAARAAALHGAFGTSSWDRIAGMAVTDLRQSLSLLRQCIADGGPVIISPTQRMQPAEVVQAITTSLSDAGVDAVARESGADVTTTRTRAIVAARTLSATLTEPHRDVVDDVIAKTARRWGGSGGTGGSGGRPRSTPLGSED